MSGSGAQKRSQALAMRAASLADQGFTHREIAALVQKPPEQIKGLVQLGLRLRSVQERDILPRRKSDG